MRRIIPIIALVLVSTQLVGGWTFPLDGGSSSASNGGSGGPKWYCMTTADNTGIVDGIYASPFIFIDGAASWNTSAPLSLALPPEPNGQWVIYAMLAEAKLALTAVGADCLYSVVHTPLGGADTVVLSIAVGDGTTLGAPDVGGACEVSVLGADALTVDDVGDYCIQRLASPTVAPVGDALGFRINDEDGGGANTCTLTVGTQLCILSQVIGEAEFH